mmetsp:Transcript_90178/g.259874  ORF Transcript_90178/g.259874 Transcript_90178/m.259874 type:complete len:251 (-) Transcript_90178:323-1075(-)
MVSTSEKAADTTVALIPLMASEIVLDALLVKSSNASNTELAYCSAWTSAMSRVLFVRRSPSMSSSSEEFCKSVTDVDKLRNDAAMSLPSAARASKDAESFSPSSLAPTATKLVEAMSPVALMAMVMLFHTGSTPPTEACTAASRAAKRALTVGSAARARSTVKLRRRAHSSRSAPDCSPTRRRVLLSDCAANTAACVAASFTNVLAWAVAFSMTSFACAARSSATAFACAVAFAAISSACSMALSTASWA